MVAVAFDTLKFVKTLEAAGVTPPHAEVFASAVRNSHETADVATKADVRELELRMASSLRELELRIKSDMQELRSDMQKLEQRMTIKLGSMMVIAVSVIAALIKLF